MNGKYREERRGDVTKERRENDGLQRECKERKRKREEDQKENIEKESKGFIDEGEQYEKKWNGTEKKSGRKKMEERIETMAKNRRKVKI